MAKGKLLILGSPDFIKKSNLDTSNFEPIIEIPFDLETVLLDEINLVEYLSKEFEIISEPVLLNIELIKLIKSGSFGRVQIFIQDILS